MRQWINIITEAALSTYEGTGFLWHGTDLLSLASMIESDYIHTSIDQDHLPNGSTNGVSLTTNPKMAWSFADRSSYIFGDNHNYHENLGPTPYTGAIVEVSADALRSHNYKMVHYVDHITFGDDEDSDEDEVRVLGQIKPLSAVLISFSFKPAEIEFFKNWVATEYAQKIAEYDPKLLHYLDRLLTHPKFKPI
jgi:hypothetical protein